jgi:2-polyprenyl-6-methoxyphenol hydroxylase-like FAD-dependent oxidoreductase
VKRPLDPATTHPVPRHAVVVGGSLTGSCAGLALSRDGWRVTIVERSCAELSGGTGISIDRRLLASVTGVDASTLPVVHVGFPATAWGLLQVALRKELLQRPAVRVRAGCRVLEVRTEENRNETVVRTTDGDLRADLVVGADGHGSIVRRFVAPDHPQAAYSGYLLWRGLIDERQVPGGFAESDIDFTEHSAGGARLVTFGVPGSDGDTTPGRRRGSFTWFDTSRTQLLRQSGKLNGDVVAGTLTGNAASGDTITELRQLARRWASPWRHAIDRTLDHREFIGTPVAEYLPAQLVRESAALIGDAAHVVSPITGAGFHNGLLDVQALTAALQTAPPGRIQQALIHYQRRRLEPARRLVAQSRQWSRAYVSSSH